jgi:hypothetical protein
MAGVGSENQQRGSNTVAIGHYGLGYYYLEKKDNQRALKHLEPPAQSGFFGINYLIGQAQHDLKNYALAEQAFRAEIEKAGHVSAAVWRLADMLDELKRYVSSILCTKWLNSDAIFLILCYESCTFERAISSYT